jgi:predicted protein tyrosine phosphatase
MFIENIAYVEALLGMHKNPGEDGILIQICEPAQDFPNPAFKFLPENIYKFDFCDVEEDGGELFEEFGMKPSQAEEIAKVLKMALEQERNVIVHCFAGLCRSGAVVEVGTMLGFTSVEGRTRMPNTWVKTQLMKKLGLSYE